MDQRHRGDPLPLILYGQGVKGRPRSEMPGPLDHQLRPQGRHRELAAPPKVVPGRRGGTQLIDRSDMDKSKSTHRVFLLLLLAPFTPHITEELWQRLDHQTSIHLESWPKWDESAAAEETITLIVQVNGRVRDRIEVPAGIDNAEAERLARESEAVQRHAGDRQIVKVIVVPGRLVNVVVK